MSLLDSQRLFLKSDREALRFLNSQPNLFACRAKWSPSYNSTPLSLYIRHAKRITTNSLTKRIWDLPVPFRVALFAWPVYFGRIHTLNKLNLRGMDIHNVCPFCKEEEECMDHLLVTCTLFKWSLEFSLPSLNRVWFSPRSVDGALEEDTIFS